MDEPKLLTRALEKSEYPEWDEMVELSPQGTIFSTSNWISLSSKALKVDFTILGCFSGDRLVGGCPFFHGKSLGILKSASNTCGMMPYSGVLLEGILDTSVRRFEKRQNEILTSLAAFFEKIGAIKVKVSNPPKLFDIRPFTQRGWVSEVKYTYFLDLKNLNYSRDVKRNIKSALKSSVSVNRSWDIKSYYTLFQRTFEHQGLRPPVPKNYLECLCEHIAANDLGDMWVAETPDGEWIAAEIFLHDNNYVHRWTAATDPELRSSGGYHLLLDTAFKNYLDKGMCTVNLMAANTPQLAEFITGFNPFLSPYFVVKRIPSLVRLLSKLL